jgi:hypothetical protein
VCKRVDVCVRELGRLPLIVIAIRAVDTPGICDELCGVVCDHCKNCRYNIDLTSTEIEVVLKSFERQRTVENGVAVGFMTTLIAGDMALGLMGVAGVLVSLGLCCGYVYTHLDKVIFDGSDEGRLRFIDVPVEMEKFLGLSSYHEVLKRTKDELLPGTDQQARVERVSKLLVCQSSCSVTEPFTAIAKPFTVFIFVYGAFRSCVWCLFFDLLCGNVDLACGEC